MPVVLSVSQKFSCECGSVCVCLCVSTLSLSDMSLFIAFCICGVSVLSLFPPPCVCRHVRSCPLYDFTAKYIFSFKKDQIILFGQLFCPTNYLTFQISNGIYIKGAIFCPFSDHFVSFQSPMGQPCTIKRLKKKRSISSPLFSSVLAASFKILSFILWLKLMVCWTIHMFAKGQKRSNQRNPEGGAST